MLYQRTRRHGQRDLWWQTHSCTNVVELSHAARPLQRAVVLGSNTFAVFRCNMFLLQEWALQNFIAPKVLQLTNKRLRNCEVKWAATGHVIASSMGRRRHCGNNVAGKAAHMRPLKDQQGTLLRTIANSATCCLQALEARLHASAREPAFEEMCPGIKCCRSQRW